MARERPRRAAAARRVPSRWAARGLLLAGAVAVGLAGCEPYVEGNGVLREEPREVPAFVGLVLSDGIQATVTAGPAQAVTVRGDENVLDFVETVVTDRAGVGKVLEVRTEKSYQSKNPLMVSVSVPVLSYLAASGASPAGVTGAAAPVFTVDALDGSQLTLAGTGGERLVVTLGGGQHGGARLDARAYPVAAAEVALTGGGHAQLRASVSVSGTAAGSGSRVENEGAGVCTVTASDGATVACSAPAP